MATLGDHVGVAIELLAGESLLHALQYGGTGVTQSCGEAPVLLACCRCSLDTQMEKSNWNWACDATVKRMRCCDWMSRPRPSPKWPDPSPHRVDTRPRPPPPPREEAAKLRECRVQFVRWWCRVLEGGEWLEQSDSRYITSRTKSPAADRRGHARANGVKYLLSAHAYTCALLGMRGPC